MLIFRSTWLATATALFFVSLGVVLEPQALNAAEPGAEVNAKFEVRYLKFISDHHFSALRMTELAAGTDELRDARVAPEEGTSPTAGAQPTQAKAASDELRSLARRNNRMQREEILTALSFLRDWYGIEYQPRISQTSQAQIDLLESAPAGMQFDHLFMEVLSRHHFIAVQPSVRCQVAFDPTHGALQRYCSGIVHAQINDITDMREMLCAEHSICDYQPLVGLKGRHSGAEGQRHTDVAVDATP